MRQDSHHLGRVGRDARRGLLRRAPSRCRPGCLRTDVWVKGVPTSSLAAVAKDIALNEIGRAIQFWTLRRDRGIALEEDWKSLRFPIQDLRDLEERGSIPSLIFSPMIVEDGRRLLISNLDLGLGPEGAITLLVESSGSLVRDVTSLGQPGDYSLSALEFFRIFPEGDGPSPVDGGPHERFFPFVSPAIELPSVPPRRVVDAGYYDNYGVDVATAWIYRHRKWLVANTSGVLLVQIRDALGVRSGSKSTILPLRLGASRPRIPVRDQPIRRRRLRQDGLLVVP